jgi:uncharacterized membrane protein
MQWTHHSGSEQGVSTRPWRPEYSSPQSFTSPRYVLYFPLALSAMAVLMWLLPSDGMLGAGCFVGTAAGFWILWDFLFRDKILRFTRVSAMGFLLGYSGGTLNTWLTLPRAGYSLASRAGLMRGELCHGIAATILASVVLLIFGELFEQPVFARENHIRITRGLKRIALFGVLAILPLVASGRLQQGGLATSGGGTGHAGILVVIFGDLVTPTVIISTIIFLMEKKSAWRFFWGFASVMLWLIQLDLGRRNLVYAAVITIPLARYAGYQWSKLSFRQILLIGLGGLFIFGGFLGYQLLRVASYGHKKPNLKQQISTAISWAEEGRAWEIAVLSTQQNVQGRTFVVAWFSDLLELSSRMPTAHGRNLVIQTEQAIPGVLIPNKPTIQEEGIASEQFNRDYPDESNSLITAGVVDFGLAGVMIYPLALVFCMSYALRWLRKALDHEIFVYALIMGLMATIATEVELTGYVVTMRDMFVIAAGLYVLLRLPSIRLKPQSVYGELS